MREDGAKVKFNCVYTKDEIDSIIMIGSLPSDFQTLMFKTLNDYIKCNTYVNSISWNGQLQQPSQSSITPNCMLKTHLFAQIHPFPIQSRTCNMAFFVQHSTTLKKLNVVH